MRLRRAMPCHKACPCPPDRQIYQTLRSSWWLKATRVDLWLLLISYSWYSSHGRETDYDCWIVFFFFFKALRHMGPFFKLSKYGPESSTRVSIKSPSIMHPQPIFLNKRNYLATLRLSGLQASPFSSGYFNR